MSNNKFEVYIGRLDNRVVYVGEGRKGRWKHLNSGMSNVYFANKAHFEGKEIEIEIIPVDCKKAAQEMELKLILELQPLWNKGCPIVNGQGGSLKPLFTKALTESKRRGVYVNKNQYTSMKFLVSKSNHLGSFIFTCKDVPTEIKTYLPRLLSNVSKGLPEYGGKLLSKFISVEKIGKSQYRITFLEEFLDYGD